MCLAEIPLHPDTMTYPFSLLALRPYKSLGSRCEIPVRRTNGMLAPADPLELRLARARGQTDIRRDQQ